MSDDVGLTRLLERWRQIHRAMRGVVAELAREQEVPEFLRRACQLAVTSGAVSHCAAVFRRDGVTVVSGRSWNLDDAGALPGCLEDCSSPAVQRALVCGTSGECEGCAFAKGTGRRTALRVYCSVGPRADTSWLFVMDREDLETEALAELLEGSAWELARHLRWIEVEQERSVVVRALENERAQLHRARDQMTAIIQASPAAILSLDAHGLVQSWNAAAERMFGWTAAEVIGRPLPFVPPEKHEESRKLTAAVMSGATLLGVKVTRVRRDGTPIELSVSTAPLRGPDGRIRGLVAATLDITEERRVASRLRETQRVLTTLMGNLQGMVYRCANDPQWTMQFVSDGCFELTGYRPEQLTGKGADRVAYGDLIHPADRERVWTQVQEALGERRPFILEYRIRDAAGTERWVWEQGCGVFSPDGPLEALEGFITDVTARRRAEDGARLGEARLASLFELSQMTAASEPDLIDYALEEAVRLTGSEIGYFHLVAADQVTVLSQSWSRAVRERCSLPGQRHHGLDSAGLWADCARYKCPIVHDDFQTLADRKGYPEGHSPIVRLMSAPIVADGVVVAVAGVANKPTAYDDSDVRQLQLFLDGLWRLLRQRRAEEQRAALEQQLRVSRKMDAIGRLAAGIVHDFNNMVAAVTGYADIVLDVTPETDPRHPDLIEIRRAGERAGALTRRLLTFARKQVFVPEVLSLNHVVADLEKMLRRVIGEDIELQVHLDPALALAELDRSQIEQVLINLVINARDAMPTGGKLVIETANVLIHGAEASSARLAEGRYVSVTVTDTGIGMDDVTRERLFEPFFTTKPEGRGTGLGLATAYGVVTQSGGTIQVTSEPGHGSSFRLLFPDVNAPSLPSVPADAMAAPGGSETVLIVEDDDAVRGVASRILSTAGYHVLEAPTGAWAIDLCDRFGGAIDLLIADVVMPGMGAVALYEEVSRRKPGVRVLYISAYSSEVIRRHGVRDDVPFLAKPFSKSDLTKQVRAILDHVSEKEADPGKNV